MEKQRAEEIINGTINELELIVAGDEDEREDTFKVWSIYVSYNDAFQDIVNHYHYSLGRDLQLALQVLNNAALAIKLATLIEAAIEKWLEDEERINHFYLEDNIENAYEAEAFSLIEDRFPNMEQIRELADTLQSKDIIKDEWDLIEKINEGK